MSTYDEARAVTYNDSMLYTAAEWMLIQAAVGVAADGDPGPITARGVRDWQGDHGLAADGMAGPDTTAMILAQAGGGCTPEPPAGVVPVGVWWDHTDGLSHEATADLLLSVGVSVVCVMLDDVPVMPYPAAPVWEKALDLAALRSIRDACKARGIRTEAACWPLPRPAHIDALSEQLPERVEALGATRLQLDVEGNWEKGDVEGFASLDRAAEVLIESLEGALDGLPLATTSFPFHAEYGAYPSLDDIHAKIPQAYSRFNKGAADYQVGAKYGPIKMQELAASRARKVLPCDLEMGVALWDQGGLYDTPEQAILEACAAATRLGAAHLWGWSLKHLIRNEYAQRALRTFLGGDSQ